MAKVTLQSKDNKDFEVPVEVAKMLGTVKSMLEETGADAPIPLGNIDGKTLGKVVAYCQYHHEHTRNAQDASKRDDGSFDKEFVKVDGDGLIDLILAANYLDIKSLLDLSCKAVADIIKNQSLDDFRKYWGIKNDFTPEEDAALKRDIEWVEEK